MNEALDSLEQAAGFIKKQLKREIDAAVILGSGLGRVSEEVEAKTSIPYGDIPGFPPVVPRGHKARMIIGTLEKKSILIFSGRFHYYQGYSMHQVVTPVRLAKRLGAGVLIITNASGGINRDYAQGDIVLIKDHINLMGYNPLIGAQQFGSVFVDMSEPYHPGLIEKAKQLSRQYPRIGKLKEGVYLAVSGPSYETRAEISFFAKIGADMVGMSTVPEVIAASQEKLKVLGLSVISNMAAGTGHHKP
ncbi:MAG: purine-nucleoside phosphorylase, partial [Spirochaetota bacterium]